MLIVALINMITVLLILILERTNMIGTLKALGMNNWNIRKIFLYNAFYIIIMGLVFGNIIGLGVAFYKKVSFHHLRRSKLLPQRCTNKNRMVIYIVAQYRNSGCDFDF